MLLQKTNFFAKSLSTSAPPTNLNWRTQIQQNQLVKQISSLLLQRYNWPQLLQPFNLHSKLNPSLFLQILKKTQTQPQISLNFFNWAVKNARFVPDLKTHCSLTRVLLESGLVSPARPILYSLIETHPPTQIVESLIVPWKGTEFDFDSQSLVFGLVIDCYCKIDLYVQALEVLLKTRSLFNKNGSKDYGEFVTVQSCNALLDVLQGKNGISVALCFYGFMLRNGVLVNQSTWDLVARILIKDGRIESVVRIIDMGVYDHFMYNLVIEFYSERGKFEVALNLLDEMHKRKLEPEFNTYASILDGDCRYVNCEVISLVMDLMVEKGYVLKVLMEYDLVVRKLLSMKKTYAANMLFKRAFDEKIMLEDDTYGCMLKVFSEEGRAKDAIGLFRVMEQRGIQVKDSSSYDAFTNVLCKEHPSDEVSRLLIDMISRGYSPSSLESSKYITSQCDNARWEEAEELVNFCLEKSIFPEASCFCSLVKHYCKSKRIDLAIALHEKMEEKDQTLDIGTYNVLLDRLTRRRMVEEAERVFGYMRRKDLLSSESFSIMITALCNENEMRKAMKLHDEMLKLELKPDRTTYKCLISRFK